MTTEFKDALNSYYGLKSQYEKNFSKEKTKIINTPGLSWREKRIEFQKLKRKCINCKRPVGSIFSIKPMKDYERHLIAMCGDRSNPCPLNIDLDVGYVVNMIDSMQNDEKEMDEYKKTIIKEKNNLLFGYTTSEQAIKDFDEIKDNIAAISSTYEYTLKRYFDISNNKEKKEELKKKQVELYLLISNFKSLVENYEKSQDTHYISEAVELYINSILPNANKIRDEKYAYSAVEYNEIDDTYSLIQKPVTLEQIGWDISSDSPKIVAMKTGIDKFQMRKKQAIENKAAIQSLPGVRASPKIILKPVIQKEESESEEEESEEEESEEEESEEDSKPKITIQPRLLEDGTISASEAGRLKWKIETIQGKLFAKNPTSGKTYEVTTGV